MTEHQEIWCQPADQPKRQFLVMFDDPQMDVAVFDDEADARAYWEKANINWTCYLMGTLPRSPSPSPRMMGSVAIRKAGDAAVQKIVDRFALTHFMPDSDDLADHLRSIVDACVKAAEVKP